MAVRADPRRASRPQQRCVSISKSTSPAARRGRNCAQLPRVSRPDIQTRPRRALHLHVKDSILVWLWGHIGMAPGSWENGRNRWLTSSSLISSGRGDLHDYRCVPRKCECAKSHTSLRSWRGDPRARGKRHNPLLLPPSPRLGPGGLPPDPVSETNPESTARLRARASASCESAPNSQHDAGRTSAAAALGHKNIQHTVRYTELSPERFRDFWKD